MKAAVLLLVVVALVSQAVAQQPCFSPSDPCATILQITNQYRQQQGVAPLTCNPKLNAAALEHSQDMSTNNYFAHTAPDGTTEEDRAIKQGYYFQIIGENIAAGSPSPQDTMTDVSFSTPAFNRLTNPSFQDFGCGFAQGGPYKYYWTFMYGLPLAGQVGHPITDSTYQYAVITYDLAKLAAPYLIFGSVCFNTSFIRETNAQGQEVGNSQQVLFMGKDSQLHLNQLFCGSPQATSLLEGASPYCPNATASNISLNVDITFTGNASANPAIAAFAAKKKADLDTWTQKYASCDLSMYSAYLLYHGEGLQHAVIRPGATTQSSDRLVQFLTNSTHRCLVQAINGIFNPDFPGVTNLMFFSVFPCPPGNTFEEIISHPDFPVVIGAVVEVAISQPVRRDVADVIQRIYNIDVTAGAQHPQHNQHYVD